MGATSISPTFLYAYLLLFLLFLCHVCSLKEGYAFGRRETAESHRLQHSHTIQVSSLLPSSFCNPSAKALDKKSSSAVVHKYGPCFQLHRDKANIPIHAEILLHDEARVKSIHSKLAKNPVSSNVDETDATSLPAKDGIVVGSGNSPGCSSSACVYGIQYGDSSFSVGFFAKESLTLTSTDVFHNFLFGCGQNNQGLFGGSAGLLGLGRNKLSLPSQAALKYKKFFSYCLPSSASSTGFLTFGYGGLSKSVKFTTLSTIFQGSSFYGIDITGISLAGQKLSISASVFTTAGAIIGSGTVITRLPPTAYVALRSAFRKRMRRYPMAQPLSILDTCYDFSKYSSVIVPKISFFFSRGVEVPIDAKVVLYVNSISQVCLAFAGNSDDTDVAIFGNTQQKTLQVVYDGAEGRIGFATRGCT